MATRRTVIDVTSIYPDSSKRKNPFAYSRIGRSIIYWRNQAQNLSDAAQVAFDDAIKSRKSTKVESTWIDSVYKYLAGMAIENLLKAIMIRKNQCLVRIDGLDKSIKSHNVWSNQRDDKLKFLQDQQQLTDDEMKFLSVVEHYVVWLGRYPIPTKASNFRDDLDTVEKFKKSHPKLEDFNKLFKSTYGKLDLLAAGGDPRKEAEIMATR
jgi:hypothetical protein